MKFGPIEVKDKLGRTIVLRNAEEKDANVLIQYMKTTAGETPFLIREPEEFRLTVEQEEGFIRSNLENPKALMLIATLDGEHIGNCSLSPVGNFKRYAHRCDVAIALYKKVWGAGIGRLMLEAVLKTAKEIGYEQAELEVIRTNETAVKLYEKLGFETYGKFPDNMKYTDGTYADALWMMKKL